VASGKDTVLVAGLERAPGRRRDGPGGMAQLVLELAPPDEPADRPVARITLHRRRRPRAAALELAGRGPREAGQGVQAGADDQLRPRRGAVTLSARAFTLAGALAAEFDQRIMLALAEAALVVLDRLHEGLQRGLDGRPALGIEQTVDPHHAVLRLAQVQIAPRMGPVGLVERALGVDAMLEVPGPPGELPRVHRLRRLQQARLCLAHRGRAHVLGGPG